MSAIRNTPQAMRLVSRIFIPLGLCITAFGVWSGMQTRAFLQRSVATSGTVIEMTQVHSSDNNGVHEYYAPIFQFRDSNGSSFTVTSNTSSNPPQFKVGEIVPVRYDPDDPTKAKIDSFLQLWLFAGVFGVVGLTFSLLGGVLFFVEQQSRNSLKTQ